MAFGFCGIFVFSGLWFVAHGGFCFLLALGLFFFLINPWLLLLIWLRHALRARVRTPVRLCDSTVSNAASTNVRRLVH